MAEAQAKVRMTLDGQQFNQQMDRARSGVKSVGQEITQWGNGLAKTMALSGALLGTIRQIAAAQAEARSEAARMGEALKSAASAEAALARTQLSSAQIQATLAAARGGVRSEAEVQSFAEKIATQRGMTGDRAINAARAFATGLASDEELMGRRIPSADELESRRQKLSPEAQTAMAARRIETLQEQRRAQSVGSETALAYSLSESAARTRALESPVASAVGEAANTVLTTMTLGLFDKQNAIATEQLAELRAMRASMSRPTAPNARGE